MASTDEKTAAAIPVFLAEDHAITLWGLQRLIESRPQAMFVVGTASSKDALLTHSALPHAQVLLMDLDLAGADGLDLLPLVQRISPARVLVLTASEDTQRLCRAVELGAKGVLHKSEPPQHILSAIEQVSGGAAWLAPQLMGQVLGRLTGAQGRTGGSPAADAQLARVASLTARERHIVGVLGQSPGEKLLGVAARLGMSENTLRNHLTTIYSKLAVRGRLELQVFAAEHGFTAD
jgi:two-component system, NarL family, nitrate/nitrite response regulator NarL